MILKDRQWRPIEKEIAQYLKKTFFDPIYEMLKQPVYNAAGSVIFALLAGRISYAHGIFTGPFNITLSKEISKYADYDGRSKTFKARIAEVPSSVTAAGVTAADKAKTLNKRLAYWLNDAENRLINIVPALSFSIEGPTDEMDQEQRREAIKHIGIVPDISEEMTAKLIEDYNKNQNLNIKNWEGNQIERLRAMITESARTGHQRRALIEKIKSEWGVTKNKAQFLARHETSLYMSKLRRERSLDAGITHYRWSTSRDERVRADHEKLNGKIFRYGDPPVVDLKTGRKAEPGEDYNCRCVAIPVVPT